MELPRDVQMNAEPLLTEVMEPFSQKPLRGSSANKPFTIIHINNVRQHTTVCLITKLSEMRLKIAPQPPYCPCAAPSDFFPFAWLKGELARQTFATDDELCYEVDELLSPLLPKTIIGVFWQWINRLKRVILPDGEYTS
jgi:transposase